jgi:hypothetical protein
MPVPVPPIPLPLLRGVVVGAGDGTRAGEALPEAVTALVTEDLRQSDHR